MTHTTKALLGGFLMGTFSLFAPLPTDAQQTVQGKVLDDRTGSPLEDAHVQVEGAEKATRCDSSGTFRIGVPKGADSIRVSHTGYRPRYIEAEGEKGLNVRLVRTSIRFPQADVVGQEKGIDEEFNRLSKLDTRPIDLPASYDHVSGKTIEQRRPDELTDAMKNATGINPINRYGGFQTFTVRGFNDFVILTDGVRDERHNLSSSAPNSNLAGVDHIEMLRGPASALYGHSALGGVVNVVRNRPTKDLQGSFSITGGSFERQRIKAGVGGPISEKLSYRVDAGFSDKEGWRDFSQTRAHGYFALNYRPSENDKLEIRSSVSRDRYNTDSGIPTDEGKVPEGMDRSTRYNDPQDFTRFEQANLQVRYTHRFNEDLKISEQFSYVKDDIQNNQGEGLVIGENKDSVHRNFYLHFNHLTTPIHNRLEATYNTKTGPVEHKFLLGHSFGKLDRKTYLGFTFAPKIHTVSIQNPDNDQGPVDVPFSEVQVKDEVFHGFYLRDWVTITSSLKLLAGVRYDHFTGRYRTDKTEHRKVVERGETTERTTGNTSFKGGLVYSFSEDLKLFASYADHFKPSRTIGREKGILDPLEGYQYEGGVKWRVVQGFQAHLTGFHIEKRNLVTEIEQGKYEQISSAVSQGAELDINGRLGKGFRIKGGYAYTLARIAEYSDEAGTDLEGNRLRFAPEHMANLWVSYGPRKGSLKNLEVSAGGNYFGDSYTDRSNEIVLPAYYTLDASIAYAFGSSSLRLMVENVTDEEYFSSAIYGDQFYPGAPRNFLLTFSHDF